MPLNKAVMNEFGVTAKYLLKQKLLQEIKNDLLSGTRNVKDIAADFGFFAPSHLMRFFKNQTGKTIGNSINEVCRNGHE